MGVGCGLFEFPGWICIVISTLTTSHGLKSCRERLGARGSTPFQGILLNTGNRGLIGKITGTYSLLAAADS